MKINIKENKKIIYFGYSREKTEDFEKLRSKIIKIIDTDALPRKKDIIIDFMDANFLYSPEMSIIAFVARELKKIDRKLIVLSTDKVEQLLMSTAMNAIDNLSFGVRNVSPEKL